MTRSEIAGRRQRRWLLAAALVPALLLATRAEAQPAATGEATLRGTVRQLTTAPKGEIDGVMLEDGTWVHWPPHLQDRFKNIVKKGDRIRVTGQMGTGKKKREPRFEVTSLTNLTTQESVDLAEPAGRAAKADMSARTVRGTVQRLTTAKKGEVDGLMLDDGTWVHWPPHLEGRFKGVKKDDRIRATGQMVTGKKGDVKFEVESLTDLTSGQTVDLAGAPARGAVQGESANREQRVRDLERQLDEIREEIGRLRSRK
jgi:hypothetical protein